MLDLKNSTLVGRTPYQTKYKQDGHFHLFTVTGPAGFNTFSNTGTNYSTFTGAADIFSVDSAWGLLGGEGDSEIERLPKYHFKVLFPLITGLAR